MKLNRKLTEADVSSVNIQSGSLSNRVSSVEQVLDNMGVSHGTGLLLAGSTGIGKTTFIKQVGKLLGMSIILIEAPHITEEHLINIPFITFKPQNQKQNGQVVIDMNNFDVTLAKSHLASELSSSRPISDQEYLRLIQNSDDNTKSIYKELGGDVDKIPDEISNIRHRYKVILFLDEYFRQTSSNVRNILRGILNGRIGNDRIPPQVYVIYASNLSDTGSTIEQIPLNADFKVMDFKAPSKDEFFHYFISRFQKSATVKLDPILIDSFYKSLDDTHISHDDVETGIRTSPRRWEQLLLYINASLPIDSREKASAVLANVKANFSSEEETSALYKIADDIVREIIEKTGNPEHKNVAPNEPAKWRNTLENQIETKMKLGNARTYIPIVMGMPGIGKTAQMASIANDLNLRLVSIDASTLSTDDITGIPIPGKESDGNLTEADKLAVRFAEPALYQRIMTDIKEADEEFMADPHVSKEKKLAFQKQPFKYLIFFDELNRVSSPNVFNSLRRVILEKSFNDRLKLPDSAIIVAAMNPGDKGTAELTGHLKDAVDLIDAHPDWPSFVEWLQSYSNVAPNLKNYSDAAKDIAYKVVSSFANTFAIKKPTDKVKMSSLKFHIHFQGGEELYISPREYWTMYADLVAGIARAIKKPSFDEDTLYKAVLQKLDSTLKWIMTKHEVESPHFLAAVADWLKQEMDKLMIKKRGAVDLTTMLDDIMKDSNKHLKDDQDFTNYVQNFDLNKFSEEVDNYFEKIMAEEHKRYEALSKNVKPVDKAKLKNKLQQDLVSKIEYILNEIEDAVDANNVAGDVIDGMHDRIMAALPSLIEDDVSDDVFNELLAKVNHIFDPDRRK